MIKKYIKRPIEVEAIKFTKNNWEEIVKFTEGMATSFQIENYLNKKFYCWCRLETLNGQVTVFENEYIIKGIDGELYPCDPEILKKTYKGIVK